ncbi:MAG: ATP-dependent metallopeptidase FtsH/Yme1/Tma family protein, partial [Syntrophorhabdaceae bacterium]
MPKSAQGPTNKSIVAVLVIILLGLFVFQIYNKPKKNHDNIPFSEFSEAISADKIASVMIQGRNITGTYKDGKEFKTFAPEDPDLVKRLREKGVRISARPDEESGIWQNIFISWFPMLLLIGVW